MSASTARAVYTFGAWGYTCTICLESDGAYGYVTVPSSHPWYGLTRRAVQRVIDSEAQVPAPVSYAERAGSGWQIGLCLPRDTPSHVLVQATQALACAARLVD